MRRQNWLEVLGRFGPFVMLAAMIAFGTLLSPLFLTASNFTNILRSVSFVGFAAIGFTFIVIAGSLIDLSAPSIVAAAGIVAVAAQPVVGVPGAILLGLGVGVAAGITNGLLVGVVRGNAVMVTLGTGVVIAGFVTIFVPGNVYTEDTTFAQLGRGMFLGLPTPVCILAVVGTGAWVILRYTTFGRWVYATGSNYEAGRVAGVPVQRVIASTFVISGLLAAVAGVLLVSLLGAARVGAGANYEFDAITVVAIGGTSLLGGSGGVARTGAGILVVGILNNLLILLGVPADAQVLVKGLVILVVVAADMTLRRRSSL